MNEIKINIKINQIKIQTQRYFKETKTVTANLKADM